MAGIWQWPLASLGLGQRAVTPSILQLEAAECGAAALSMVLGYFGRHMPLEELRTACGVSRDGSKASNILKAARAFGLTAKGLKAEPENLRDLTPPMIAFVNFNHFVVVEGIRGRTVYLNDPASGQRKVDFEEFNEMFTGVVLIFARGEEFERGSSRPSVLGSLYGRLSGYKLPLLFVFLVSIAVVLPGIIVPVFSRIFVDYVLVRGLNDWLPPLMIGMFVTAIIRYVLAEMQSHTLARINIALASDSSRKFLSHLLSLPISFFDQRFAGEIAQRMELNEGLADLLTGEFVRAALSALMAVFFLAVMLTYHIPLAVVIVVLALVNLVFLVATSRYLAARYRKISIDDGKYQSAVIAGLRDIETFKASGTEDTLFTRWSGLYANVANGEHAVSRVQSWLSAVPGLLQALSIAAVLIIGGRAVMDGQMTLGMLVAFQSLAASFMVPIANLTNFGAQLQQLQSYLSRLDDVLAQNTDVRFRATANGGLDKLPNGQISLIDVSFGYAPLDAPLIRDLSLEVKPGSRIALVGASGSGKSTIGKLIAGLVSPRSGSMCLDGRPIHKWPRSVCAARFAYVDQKNSLFEGTIRENLMLWDESIEEQAIVRAAHDAGIHEIISARPGSYDSQVSEAGRNFSGGERQRLELARALSIDPSIIVLDEATSALDPITEKEVMDAIRRRGATCIIIAHRLSTIRDCDEIIVLDQGLPVERGNHQELMIQNGHYASLLEA